MDIQELYEKISEYDARQFEFDHEDGIHTLRLIGDGTEVVLKSFHSSPPPEQEGDTLVIIVEEAYIISEGDKTELDLDNPMQLNLDGIVPHIKRDLDR